MRNARVILDTDIGGDADDALAVAVAARLVPQLALVITADEVDGERARFARHLLDLLGRTDVVVVSGRSLSSSALFCVEGLTPGTVPAQDRDVIPAVEALLSTSTSPVHWVGMGPMSNLADIVLAAPEWAGRLVVTQMGGALDYRDPTRAEHNFRLDPDAAGTVLGQIGSPRLVISDVTFTPETEVVRESAIFQALARRDGPPWAELLAAHMTRWFARHHCGSMQHDGLTLSLALGLPFVDGEMSRITVAADGRMFARPDGSPAWLATRADYPAFMRWFEAALNPEGMRRGRTG